MTEVFCVPKPTPTPSVIATVRLILALVVAFFMVSSWDDLLDELIRKYIVGQRSTTLALVVRAVIATMVAILILLFVHIDIDDVFGAFLHS